eukprot:TRINITY_DN12128_c0_g1_i2.p1 TRINITY_DN12128_c0_g1~~TRINITY_DN12128_c0_g1_i2.p1  ORF type:complete len:217 (-),score=34.96 TRINITY_DN12128_c0_g1_i2:45-695(-)
MCIRDRSLEVWSPVLRTLCTMPILRRGSIRAGGTHKLRESAYVTTKRHIKPNASGVCIFILVTGCVPEKAALRNLVVYFIESAIGLLGGTVVGSVELPSTEDTIMPVDTTTHVLLLDLDRCTISGDDNNQEGNKPSRSIPEDLLPPVLLPEYTNSSLEFVDAASWLASSVEALSLIHISEPTRLLSISYAVFCLKKKKKTTTHLECCYTVHQYIKI